MTEYTLPVQLCPFCQQPGERLPAGPSLALDVQCMSCRLYYTSVAHRAVLHALTNRPAPERTA